ncbi:cadherin EGF LAG seven-pass G-type receptor 3 [Cottoperca gobio]|uniref:Cadherin EGF LAG seven-pass G-type receptor 3 n=1 Tax=Cottoperca gobio TaxID=56716 RepID=A0A6J2Q002_COTGO|nr:cadherin EGF LAG seven-pass G-type receptor 3 [Cottoperca gobio]
MAVPLPGFNPLLLLSLALHLLLLGPLFALTPGTVNTGGASNRWTPGLCYRDAGKVSQQQQREEAGESPRDSWNLRPSRWTVERIQTVGCSGVQRAGGTLGGYHHDGARGTRKGVGTFWRSGNGPPAPSLPPPPLHPSIRSRSSSDGVGVREGVEGGRMRRKGVVSPPASPAFTYSPVQNGKKRAVQRTRACAQRWPASGPHLAKRGAARAFVHASGLCRAPGSVEMKGGEVWERAREVRRLLATWSSLTPGHLCWSSSDKQALSPANNPSLGPLPTGCSCCIHPLSGYNSLHSEASNYTFKYYPQFTNNSDCIQESKLEYICHFSTCNSSQTGHTDKIQPHPVYRNSNYNKARNADGGSASMDRRAGNCSHLGRHNVIDPSSIREGGDDSCLAGCIRCRDRGTRSAGDEEEGKETYRCSSPAVINPNTWAHQYWCGFPVSEVKSVYYHARIIDKKREGNDGRGGGVNQGYKHINLSNYADNDLAFPIQTRLCKADNELPQGKSAPVTRGQSSQTRGESREVAGGCFSCLDRIEMGGGYLAEFMVPQGVIAQRNLPIQFPPISITEASGQRFLSNKSAIPKIASKCSGLVLNTPPQTQTADYSESGKLYKLLCLSAEKVKASSETESAGDSGFFLPVKFPVKSPTSRSATALTPRFITQHDDTTAKHLSFFKEINSSQDDSARSLHLSSVISAPRTASPDSQQVFLWSKFNSNSNNNNEEEASKEKNGYSHESEVEKLPWHGQTQQQDLWETALREMVKAGCADSISTDCSATKQRDHAHMQLKSGKQVSLEPEGVRQSDRRQMGAERESEAEREGEGFEGSAAVAVGGGKLQVGEGKREARLMGGREPWGKEQEEEEREKRITKAGQAEEREAERGKGQDRGSSSTTIIQPNREKGKTESQADESHEVGKGDERGVEGEEEGHSTRGERSLERLIIVADDEISQGERGRKILMPWPRSRRAANRHPHFSQYNFQVQVAENQPPGTSVIIMSASDPDAGDAGRVSYSMAPLMNSRSSDYFHIHPDTGIITTTQILDREHMDLHYFRVTGTDYGSSRLSGTTMVAITVADRNDHSPIFEQKEYRETIRENVEEGYPILQLRATDLDSPSNANIRYRFIGDTIAMARAAFEIDPRSGLITTRGAVDRETNEHYTLQVEASDQGKEPGPRSATVKVFIDVLDENDNVPQFSEKRYVVAVKEDVRPHSDILRVSATDLDKDSNAAVHYNIISGNSRGQFSIDSVTGEIHVVAPLDYEAEREYTLRVRAQDNGRPPLSNNTGIVSVQVTDVNDNPPIFVSTPFQASVLESAPVGSSILHIQAIDTDSGDNARLEYRLTGTSSDTPFIINSATGWVTVRSILDRESVEHYFFGVEARDYGMPPLSATASVTITVMDVNDNRPEFLQREYYSRLNEDASVGTSVVIVTAVDRDVNSAVTYQITGGNTRNRFAISTAGGSGLLSLALPLDYKQERRYVLTVTASDRTLHDTCQVHINITDANTHRPVFQSAHYSISVNEDRPPGSTVVVISATDDDVGENARITYFLEDNIPQFRIDTASGAITLQAELDYEDQMTYTLAITAKDNGIPQKADTTYVEVNVNDVNDNSPQFLSPRYQGTVSEDAPPFTSVLQISATDRDAHANGRVQYTFQNGEDGDGDFTIEPTSGIVRTVRRLDRESVPFYELTAYAVDRGVPPQRTPVHIQVTVLDVNDNAPVFPADDFEVLVKENSAVGSVVAQITATDPDEGANAQIMYQIVEGNIPEIFQMDIFSGELTSLIDLDYEAHNEYVIVVQATSAPLVSRATIRIRLVDQNDNRPTLQDFQIIFNNFVSNRSNSFPSGVIGRVPAHDPDVSDRLYYTIDRGNELHLLLLNHTSGEIRLSRKLDNNRPLVAPMLITVTVSSSLLILRIIPTFMEFHYRLRGSDTCLPCDCYPVGSFSRSCDPETGQCQCRPGVIGRQCNICDSPFAEVTNSGCDVIYDGCPKTITQGIWWPRTKFNLPAAVPCPKGSVGAAIRHCEMERGWLEPDLYNCTSPPFVELNAALDSLERNETELNTIMEKKLAHQLRDVTEATARLYGNDLQIAERLLSRLLTFETQQSGFGLTATQDAHFNENVVRGCSVLLGPGTSGLWRALAQSQNHIPGGGPAELTELLEQYTQKLAQNMKLTYLNPVALVSPNIVMNLDRVENQTHVRRRFPRYHTTLFRGQALWDPNTHVILPPAALVPQRQQQQHNWKEKERTEKETLVPQNAAPASVSISANQTGEYTAARRTVSLPEPPITIVILLIYRSLGGALPPKYHTDRRGVRLPRHPVMNSPVVSISVYNNQTFVGGHLDQPILLEFKLLETANRSKPLCVQWNHSSLYELGGCWTVRDCMVVYRNTSHVRCQCQRLGTFGVLMDSSHREQLEGDLETLALVTYSSLCVSMLALLFTVLVLSCLRGLKSNTRSIHSNTAAAMFLSELVFLLGVNQTEQQFLCTVVAILLHYFFMSTFAWLFVEGLHIYRMQTEQRNINYGAMRFYYAIGWGVPAIITGLAVGLDPEGYGNPDFCWISIYDKLIWSFAGPIAIVILMNGGIFMIVAKMSCNPSQKESKKLPVIATIRNAFLLLLLATSTWLCGLMAVNNSILAFYYIFDVLCLVQGVSVMLVFTVFNSEVKEAWSVACLGKKSPGEDPPRPSQNTAQNPYHNASLLEQSGLHRITLGTSTISSVSSARENLLARQTLEQNIVQTGATDLDVAMFHRDGGEDSDSDSDLSMEEERSLSIPSSESEDNVRLRGRIQRRFKRSNHSERLLTEPTHNGTKDLDGNDLLSYWPALEECETHSLQKWGSERPLGADYSKDAANNNQPDAALTSGDENGLTQPHRHRKGILKNRLGCPPALQGLSTMGRVPSELNWYRTSTLGHRGVPAASYGRMYSAGGGSGSLSQPASRYSSREHLDSLSRRQLSRDTLGRQTVGGSRDRLDSRGSRDNLDLLPRRRELGQGAGLGGLGLDHQRVSSSRENLSGSRDRLDNHHTGSVHTSREDLSGGAGMEGYLSGSRSQLNSLTRRQASSREHLGGALMSSRSREQLETNGSGVQAQPCREWLRTLPPRQPSHPDQPPSSSPPPPISEEPQQDQLPSHLRGRLDSAPPCMYPGQTVPQVAGSSPNTLGRQPSSEHLDILSSILASFSSSVLTPPPAASNPGPNGSAHGHSPSLSQSATSHSISEVSPDSEANRSEGQS